MELIKKIEDQFAQETFDSKDIRISKLNETIQTIKAFVNIDQSVAVLSDLAENKSHIIVGSFGRYLGMKESEHIIIDSIWEKEIYNRIHPDDIFERHLLELEFFNFLKQLPPNDRLNYHTSCQIRATNQQQNYQYISHRTQYVKNSSKNGLWLAVCLYNYSFEDAPANNINGKINNSKTGESFDVTTYNNCTELLSPREKQVLILVRDGLLSKEIAEKLHISINTINRHRQNILLKLQVNNSLEAVRIAIRLKII